jgi:hypothetical protein
MLSISCLIFGPFFKMLGKARATSVRRGSDPEVCYDGTVSAQIPDTRQRRVTRDVTVAAVRDLIEQPPRATVAFADRDDVDLLPAVARANGERYTFGICADRAPNLETREVVLVIDDGSYWFELRGVSVRGTATRVEPPGDRDEHLVWYAITARRVLAWDYGAIREE